MGMIERGLRGLLLSAAVALGLSATMAAAAGSVCDATWTDPARAGRGVSVRIRMPDGTAKAPVILFSHGLGGSIDSGRAWAQAWADAGLIVVNIQHPGSDRAIIMSGHLRDAMSAEQLFARVADVHFVIDELGRRTIEGKCDLSRADLSRIGMSGHSFGAHTTQAIAGQHYPVALADKIADPRVKAAIAFSPAPPAIGSVGAAFGTVHIPFLSITGTADTVPLTPGVKAEDRVRPFAAMPPGDKYLLVLDGATHMAFNGRGDRAFGGAALTPHIEQVVEAATIAFWRATLMDDAEAKRRLAAHDFGLAAGDRWDSR
jgi:predicted dienelactone hydrolase